MRRRFLALSFLAACCPTPPAHEPTVPDLVGPAPAPLPPPPPGAETVDEGTFAFTFKGAQAGRETFAIRKSDVLTIDHDTLLQVDGNEVASRGTLVTGLDWKPRNGAFKARTGKTEVESTLVAGPPLTVTVNNAGTKQAIPATRDVDYFLSDNVMIHLTPLCALPGEVTTRHAFPGAEIKVALPVAVPEDAPIAGVARRTLELGGSLSADLVCQGTKLIAIDVPLVGITATRLGSEELVEKVRRKERKKPALADGLVELDRKVNVAASKDVEAVTLACSLVLPASHAEVNARGTKGAPAPLPAVVFLTGSGKQDRDEDTYGPGGLKLSIFKVMANELGKAGIASLRCDDRGSGGSNGDFAKASLPAFAADATAMVAALRVEPAVDPKRVGIVGHSEGAVVAPVVASNDRKVRALVLMAGPGRPIDVLVIEQLERAAKASGAPQERVDAELAKTRAVFAAFRKGEPLPAELSEGEKGYWEEARVWIRGYLDHDPAVVARKLKRVAVLIAQGDKDAQVSVADADALRAAFNKAGNKKVEYKVYVDHNHLFAKSTTGNVSEYTDPNANVDLAFIADVAAFLKKRL